MYCPRPIVLIWQKNQFIGGQEAVYTTQVHNSGSDYQAQWRFHFLSPIVPRGLPSKYKVFLQKQELHPLPPCQATSAWIFNTFQRVKLFASWRHGSSAPFFQLVELFAFRRQVHHIESYPRLSTSWPAALMKPSFLVQLRICGLASWSTDYFSNPRHINLTLCYRYRHLTINLPCQPSIYENLSGLLPKNVQTILHLG